MISFRKRVDGKGPEALHAIQTAILNDPEAGDLIPGTGGLRKIRVAAVGSGKGKRGGLRVIYLDLPRIGETHLLAVYSKNEQADISDDEKSVLRAWAVRIRSEKKRLR